MAWWTWELAAGCAIAVAWIGAGISRSKRAAGVNQIGWQRGQWLLHVLGAWGVAVMLPALWGPPQPVIPAAPWSVQDAVMLLVAVPWFGWMAATLCRLRCATIADWFAQRFESRPLGAAAAGLGLIMVLACGLWTLAALKTVTLGPAAQTAPAGELLCVGGPRVDFSVTCVSVGLAVVVALVQPQLFTLAGLAGRERAARWGTVAGLLMAVATVAGCGWLSGPATEPPGLGAEEWGRYGAAFRVAAHAATAGGDGVARVALRMTTVVALGAALGVLTLAAAPLAMRFLATPGIQPQRAASQRARAIGRPVAAVGLVAALACVIWTTGGGDLCRRMMWAVPTTLGAPLLLGLYWRRATCAAAWWTLMVGTNVLLVAPVLAPLACPELRDCPELGALSRWVQYDPPELRETESSETGVSARTRFRVGGDAIYWSGGVHQLGTDGRELPDAVPVAAGGPWTHADGWRLTPLGYPAGTRLRGDGLLQVELLLLPLAGVQPSTMRDETLTGLAWVVRIALPWATMVLVSLCTGPSSQSTLNRQLARLGTPVTADDELDRTRLVSVFGSPELLDADRLLPGTNCDLTRRTARELGLAAAWGVGLTYLLGRLVVW